MKRRGKNESFYESFSDLIFTTMAIFVLLFVVMLTQVNKAPKPQKAVDLVFVIDTTGTMEEEIGQLKTSVSTIIGMLPYVLRDVRIAIVKMNDEGTKSLDFKHLDFIPVGDDGNSASLIVGWLSGIKSPQGQVTDVISATSFAIELIDAARDDSRLTALVLISDIGPYEYWNRRPVEIDEIPLLERRLVKLANDFVSESKNRRFYAVFPGQAAESAVENQNTAPGRTRQLYCSMARAAGTQGRFFGGLDDVLSLPAAFGRDFLGTDEEIARTLIEPMC